MIRLRYSMAILLALGLLIMGGLGGYLFQRGRFPGAPTPAPTERADRDNPPVVVGVYAPFPGASAEEVERNITTPIEVQIAGLPNITAVRSISLFGLSDIKIQFSYDVTFAETFDVKDTRVMKGSELGRLKVDIAHAPGSLLVRYRPHEITAAH